MSKLYYIKFKKNMPEFNPNIRVHYFLLDNIGLISCYYCGWRYRFEAISQKVYAQRFQKIRKTSGNKDVEVKPYQIDGNLEESIKKAIESKDEELVNKVGDELLKLVKINV